MVAKELFPYRSHWELGQSKGWSVKDRPTGFGANGTLLPNTTACHAGKTGNTGVPSPLEAPSPPSGSLALRLWETLETWWFRHRSRWLLATLDDRILKDIGISSVDALKESSKPFWLK